MSKKNILITGGTGFLGSHIVTTLCKKMNIILLKRKMSPLHRIAHVIDQIKMYDIDEVNMLSVFEENKIDIVLHCATHYGRKTIDPIEIVNANLILPLSLLHNTRLFGIPCFINTDTILDKGVNTYSLSKSQFNEWLKILSSETVCLNLKLEHFYGPQDDPSKFVTYIIHALLKNEKKIDLTIGEQLRYFLHVNDVVSAFSLILEKSLSINKGYHEFQIGAQECISIRNLTELIKNIIGNNLTRLNYGAIPYRNNEVMKPSIDIDAIVKMGWHETIPLESGLKDTIKIEREILGL